MQNFVSLLEGFEKMRFWKVSPMLPFGCAMPDDCISVAEWNDLVGKLLNLCPFHLRVKRLFYFDLIKNSACPPAVFERQNCGNLKNKLYIYPDFNVYPCTCLTDFSVGNLLRSNIEDILKTKKAERFLNYTLCPSSPCNDCEHKPWCNGGCIGMSYNHYGKIGMGDFRCPIHQNHIIK